VRPPRQIPCVVVAYDHNVPPEPAKCWMRPTPFIIAPSRQGKSLLQKIASGLTLSEDNPSSAIAPPICRLGIVKSVPYLFGHTRRGPVPGQNLANRNLFFPSPSASKFEEAGPVSIATAATTPCWQQFSAERSWRAVITSQDPRNNCRAPRTREAGTAIKHVRKSWFCFFQGMIKSVKSRNELRNMICFRPRERPPTNHGQNMASGCRIPWAFPFPTSRKPKPVLRFRSTNGEPPPLTR